MQGFRAIALHHLPIICRSSGTSILEYIGKYFKFRIEKKIGNGVLIFSHLTLLIILLWCLLDNFLFKFHKIAGVFDGEFTYFCSSQ